MQTNNFLADSLNRLNEIFSKRYGCAIEYLAPENVPQSIMSGIFSSRDELFKSGEPVTEDTSTLLPLYVNNNFAGAARIKDADKITTPDRQNLFQFISLMIERRLEQMQLDEPITRSGNVIPIRAFKPNIYPVINKSKNSSTFSFSFMIESQNENDTLKMALEIHDRTQRLAFIRIEDLDESVFDSADAINSLGNITVFVQDITKVPHATQRKLIKFFESSRDKWSPQFIAGTQLGHAQLRNDIRVYNALLPALSVGYLRMTQPFEFYRREKLLEFFFDSLTGRNSV